MRRTEIARFGSMMDQARELLAGRMLMRVECWVLVLAGLSLAGGCNLSRETPSLESRYAAGTIPALKRVGLTDEPVSKEVLTDVVDQLESPDAAVRLYAIEALEKLTGQNMGYNYFDDTDPRQLAVARWRSWLDQQPDPFVPVGAVKK